jgi:predicted amidohydrolase
VIIGPGRIIARTSRSRRKIAAMTSPTTIALASPSVASSLDEGLDKIEQLMSDASKRGAGLVCFPEAYLPGLRGQDFDVFPFDQADQDRALAAVAGWSRTFGIGTILGMERLTPGGRQIAAFVITAEGDVQGFQAKTQIDPSEDRFYVPGTGRRLFEINGLKFGIAICHEGWRYPETVRWAAVRGAAIVFHPQHTGTQHDGVCLTEWGDSAAPYYERAMMMRSIENAIYFASVNYALKFQESATSLIAPSGQLQAHLPYGMEGVLVQTIDPAEATGVLARRYAPERYHELVKSAST